MQTLISTTPKFDFQIWGQRLMARFRSHVVATDSDQLTLEDFLHQVEDELNAGLSVSDHDMIACTAGCGSCCRVNVAILSPEAHNIAAYLRRTCTASELKQLCMRMRQMLVAINGLDDDERIATNQPCAFLNEERSCSIYPVRPLLCRSVTSTCAEACRAALRSNIFEERGTVVMNLFQKDLMDAAFNTLAQLWHESGGDSRSRELTAAVYPLLQH
ncbi:MAG: YkgJ family cysteine cluster protein [Desulfuromonadaceae bacterium]